MIAHIWHTLGRANSRLEPDPPALVWLVVALVAAMMALTAARAARCWDARQETEAYNGNP